jgi:hypothetical protein
MSRITGTTTLQTGTKRDASITKLSSYGSYFELSLCQYIFIGFKGGLTFFLFIFAHPPVPGKYFLRQ